MSLMGNPYRELYRVGLVAAGIASAYALTEPVQSVVQPGFQQDREQHIASADRIYQAMEEKYQQHNEAYMAKDPNAPALLQSYTTLVEAHDAAIAEVGHDTREAMAFTGGVAIAGALLAHITVKGIRKVVGRKNK